MNIRDFIKETVLKLPVEKKLAFIKNGLYIDELFRDQNPKVHAAILRSVVFPVSDEIEEWHILSDKPFEIKIRCDAHVDASTSTINFSVNDPSTS